MVLTPKSIKRAEDATGDEVLTFETAGGKHVQSVAQVDDAGAQALEWNTNNVEEASATVTYVGKETPGGQWLMMKIDSSLGTVIRYASLANNAGVASYATAWTARATLTYGYFAEAI